MLDSPCLSKLASVIGKPIHCNGPTTNMTRLSYARVLIEVDLLRDLPSSVNVVLPNGSPLAQQVMYESLPRFCKQCYVLGHTVSTFHKGLKRKKRPQDIHDDSGSPSAETEAVEKEHMYSQGLPIDTPVDPMSTEAATSEFRRHSSPGHKRTKLVASSTPKPASGSVHDTDNLEDMSALPVKRQYLTRSKASKIVAHPCLGQQGTSKGLVPV